MDRAARGAVVIGRIACAAAAAAALVGCSTWNTDHTPTHRHVIVVEGVPTGPLESGDRLDVVPDRQTPDACDHIGGTPAMRADGLLVCEWADF